MAKPIPVEVRERIVLAFDQGHTREEIAELYGVGTRLSRGSWPGAGKQEASLRLRGRVGRQFWTDVPTRRYADGSR